LQDLAISGTTHVVHRYLVVQIEVVKPHCIIIPGYGTLLRSDEVLDITMNINYC
jgi:hypothetical protein